MRVELTPMSLTTVPSYYASVRPLKNVAFEDLVVAVVAANPLYSSDLVSSIAKLMMDEIKKELIEGNFVNLEGYMSFRTTLPGRVNDISVPIDSNLIEIAINASVPYRDAVRNGSTVVKLPITQKAPVIEWQMDTESGYESFLSSTGIIHIRGQNLKFPVEAGYGLKVYNTLEETSAFSTVVGMNRNTQILGIPVLNATVASNEHQLSVVTKYTENGSTREGFHQGYLRSEIGIDLVGDYPLDVFAGLIGGSAPAQIVSAAVSAPVDITLITLYNPVAQQLETHAEIGSAIGESVAYTGNGVIAVPAAGGASAMSIDILSYVNLRNMIRSNYNSYLTEQCHVAITGP